MVPNKEGLYSRANPVSPPSHMLGPSPIMTGVQNILHMSSQNVAPPPQIQPVYSKEMTMTTVQYQYGSSKPSVQPPLPMRHKVHTSTNMALSGPGTLPGSSQHFQRLKVEDALSYLDQVKYKFGTQPQVYNDFLDIMKEFKSQSIDTPGVIQRVSNLFKGHPELIVGFNTFLPPGYKIEVQSNEQGYAFQVSVSMPSPTTSAPTLIQTSHHSIGPPNEPLTIMPGGVKIQGPPPIMPRTTSPQSVPASHYQPHPPTTAPPGLLAATGFGMLPLAQQQAHLAVSHALNSVDNPHPHPSTQSQPVEFNHAINYVNKIKNRFQGQPDKYKKFLEILHTYQKEQRIAKEGSCAPLKHLTEAEVYSQVSKLFEHQEDLLAEFGQFLPDATSHLNAKNLPIPEHVNVLPKKAAVPLKAMSHPRDSSGSERDTPRASAPKPAPLKRSPSFSATTPKKHRTSTLRDGITLVEAGKYANLNDYAFFDKVRRILKSPDVYDNFLRCLNLFNYELVSKMELLQMVTPCLSRSPDLLRSFKDFLGLTESASMQSRIDVIPTARQDRAQGDLAMEIDYATCKRLGISYCALPKTYPLPKTSGRTALCREVLNDTWVSFPTWAEDSTFVTCRKTIYEEYIYRCEDERFELDVVIETNGATIRVLEAVQKKISRMTPEEAQKFRLDDCLGGTSPTIHLRAISRVYGDKAPDMIDGLKKSPLVAIPVVLRRLRAKEEEWREAQKKFNKIWREQNEKYYLKSLDHQGMNFKQTDAKYIGSKSLYAEIETICEERNENSEDAAPDAPHLVLVYKDKTILDDASNLLIHHAKRISGLQKEDKHKMKVILRHFLPDLFQHARQELSDDEKDDTESMEVNPKQGDDGGNAANGEIKIEPGTSKAIAPGDSDESYSFFVTNNNWYWFLRLHHILCERLTKMYERAEALAVEEAAEKLQRTESTSVALRLKPKMDVEVSDYYPALLDMVKGVLDGNMESGTYEDNLREMFGIHAYIAFTLDKVVTYAVRQLQHIVCDEIPQSCMEQFSQEVKREGAGGLLRTQHQRTSLETAYQKRVEQLLTDESCFRIIIYHKNCKMTMELLDTDVGEPEGGDSLKWGHYRDSLMDSMRGYQDEDTQPMEKPMFRAKNVRSWKRMHAKAPETVIKKEDSQGEAMDEDTHAEGGLRMGELPSNDVVAQDDTECRFNLSSYKILFVINKDNLLYRKNALTIAKKTHPKVTSTKYAKYKKVVDAWVGENCTEADLRTNTDWLMGRGPDMHPNRTVIANDNSLNRSPYRPYNRYVVQMLD